MPRHVTVGLHATIVAVTDAEPRVLTVSAGGGDDGFPALPFGPLDPDRHRTLELGLRAWVREQTGMELAHVEQLYTFGDRDRAGAGDGEARVIAVAYLALVRERHVEAGHPAAWEAVYRFLPWEDRRGGEPALLREGIRPALDAWIAAAPPGDPRRERRGRADITFGAGAAPWDAERVLDRYELLYEAGLVAEARRDGDPAAPRSASDPAAPRSASDPAAPRSASDPAAPRSASDPAAPRSASDPAAPRSASDPAAPRAASDPAAFGAPLALDHRRILATALGRLRGKLKYRPLVFELLPEAFTLLQLQRTVETLAGVRLHKQNFRRLVERGGLVEGTGRVESATGGRPAELFRFRREVQHERPAPGVGLPGLPATS